jgi:hypothetical protein
MSEGIQKQYDILYQYFKNTTEPFDELIWDGKTLIVVHNNIEKERYSLFDLKEIIPEFNQKTYLSK